MNRPVRAPGPRTRLGRARRAAHHRVLRARSRNSSFTIVCDDCWAGSVYQSLGLPYTTPFIGLIIGPESYLALLSDLRGYLSQPLVFTERSRDYSPNDPVEGPMPYPIATLGEDVEIRFLHYADADEVREKWSRRIERMDWDSLFVKFAGDLKDYPVPDERFAQFEAAPFERKLALTMDSRRAAEFPSAVRMRAPILDGARMYYRTLRDFDVVDWVNGGSGAVSRPALAVDALLNGDRGAWRPTGEPSD